MGNQGPDISKGLLTCTCNWDSVATSRYIPPVYSCRNHLTAMRWVGQVVFLIIPCSTGHTSSCLSWKEYFNIIVRKVCNSFDFDASSVDIMYKFEHWL